MYDIVDRKKEENSELHHIHTDIKTKNIEAAVSILSDFEVNANKKLFIAEYIIFTSAINFIMEFKNLYGKPVQILAFSNDNKILVNDEPLKEMLQHPNVRNRKIVVFSISGAYRRGKSFFLNYCLRFLYAHYQSLNNPNYKCSNPKNWMGHRDESLKGFSWRSGSNRDTNGVMIWNDVFLYTDSKSGEKIAIVVLDTQGFFASETTAMESNRIFALGTLISSIQVLNLSNVIQEDQIQYLQFATEFAKFSTSENDGAFNKPFQNLTLLIRDWANPCEFDYGVEGGEKYLRNFLKIKSSQNNELKSVRQFVLNSFDKLSCALLPNPGKVVAGGMKFVTEYNGNWGKMDEDFKDELETLIQSLLSSNNLVRKKINGRELTSAEYHEYVNQYLTLFQSDKLPEAKSIYETTIEKQMDILINKCIDDYKQTLFKYQDSITGVEQIPDFHDMSKNKAIVMFNEAKKVNNVEAALKYEKILVHEIEKYYTCWKVQMMSSIQKINVEKEKVKAINAEKQKYQSEQDEIERRVAEMRISNAQRSKMNQDALIEKRITEALLRAEHERKPERAIDSQVFQNKIKTELSELLYSLPIDSPMSSVDAQHPHGHPIALQYTDRNNSIHVDYNTIDAMFLHPEVRNRKVVVVSIAGAYRKGKSFFLDYCLRFLYANYRSLKSKNGNLSKSNWNSDKDEPLRGFTWKHGCQADTNGVLIWSDIFLYDKPNGDKIAIALIDTQGLFEPNKHGRENARIFGLSNLISSVQIYNLRGEVQENELEYLEMATEFTKYIANSNCHESQSVSTIKPFQNLLFLIRDWNDENFTCGYKGGKRYLIENVLDSNRSTGNAVAESVRKNIQSSFDKIDCFLLSYPGEMIAKKHFDGRWSELNRDFVRHLEKLIESIFSPDKLIEKRMLNVEVTGQVYRDYIVTYFKAFQSEELPEFQTLYQMTLFNQMSSIIEKLMVEYKNDLNQMIDLNSANLEATVDSTHAKVKSLTIEKFRKTKKMGDIETEMHFVNVLGQKLDEIFNEWRFEIMRSYNSKKKSDDDIKKLKLHHEEEKRRLDENLKNVQANLQKKFNEKLEQEKNERRRLELEALRNSDGNGDFLTDGVGKVVDGIASIAKGAAHIFIQRGIGKLFSKLRF